MVPCQEMENTVVLVVEILENKRPSRIFLMSLESLFNQTKIASAASFFGLLLLNATLLGWLFGSRWRGCGRSRCRRFRGLHWLLHLLRLELVLWVRNHGTGSGQLVLWLLDILHLRSCSVCHWRCSVCHWLLDILNLRLLDILDLRLLDILDLLRCSICLRCRVCHLWLGILNLRRSRVRHWRRVALRWGRIRHWRRIRRRCRIRGGSGVSHGCCVRGSSSINDRHC